ADPPADRALAALPAVHAQPALGAAAASHLRGRAWRRWPVLFLHLPQAARRRLTWLTRSALPPAAWLSVLPARARLGPLDRSASRHADTRPEACRPAPAPRSALIRPADIA